MPGAMEQAGRRRVWLFHGRPYDPDLGVEVDVWGSTSIIAVETTELLKLNQTDDAPGCSTMAACSGGTLGATPVGALVASNADLGSVEKVFTSFPSGASSIFAVFESAPVGRETWQAGSYTVRINVTSPAPVGSLWVETHVCRVNDACGVVSTVGSATGKAIALSGAAGPRQMVVTGSQSTGDAADRIYIVLTASHPSSTSLGITPDQVIDTPIEDPMLPPAGPIKLSVKEPMSISASLVLSGGSLARHALPSIGDTVLPNPDGIWDPILRYSWGHRRIRWLKGWDDQQPSEYEVVWDGQAQGITRADREEIVIGTRGLEDLFKHNLQQRVFQPGFEPYFIGDGVDNQIDFGDNLDRGASGLTIGYAFRTSTLQTAGGYAKKSGVAAVNAGYGLMLGVGGSIRFDLADGVAQFNVAVTPPGGYDTGTRIAVIGRLQKSTNTAWLYWNLYDGSGWVEAGTLDVTGLGNLDNAVSLFAGRHGTGGFLTGEIERLVMTGSGSFADLQLVQAALDERFAEDVDPTPFIHYVPLSENLGLLAGDLSPSGFDGTISGNADSDKLWSGTMNGTRDLEGQPYPYALGRSSVNPIVWLDPVKYIGILSSESFFAPVLEDGVREGGVVFEEDTTTGGPINTNAPAEGEFRTRNVPDTENGAPRGTYIRFNPPVDITGDVTVSLDEAAFPQPGILAGRLAFFKIPGANLIGSAEIDAVTPYTCGHYWAREHVLAMDALDEVLASAWAHWTVDPRQPRSPNGSLRVVAFQLRDLTGETPDHEWYLGDDINLASFMRDGLVLQGYAPTWRTATLNYNRYRGALPFSSIFDSVSLDQRVNLSQEWRSVTWPEDQDDIDALLEQFLDAEDASFDTGIWSRADALAEVARRFAIQNGAAPDYRALPIQGGEVIGVKGKVWLGDVAAIHGDRFGLESGLLFLVLGAQEDQDPERGTQVDLWGGFPLS